MADVELNPSPESTWGATEEYKAAWLQKYGTVAPGKSASKAEWVEFAVKAGKSQEDAENATRDELAAEFTPGEVVSAPSAPNEPVAEAETAGVDTGPATSGASNTANLSGSTNAR